EARAFGPERCEWSGFQRNRPLDSVGFLISAASTSQAAYFETSRSFLEQIVDRFLKPLGVTETVSRSFAAQSGVLDFLVVATIERLNNSVSLPFSWKVCSNTGDAGFAPCEPGLEIRYAIGLSRLSGSFRIFLPHEFLLQMMRTFAGPVSQREIPAT